MIVDGVDPRRVFKIKATTRLNVAPRGLELLGDTADWTYFVLPADADATRFTHDLEQYTSGEGPKVLQEFFGDITEIESYGPADRRGPGLPPGPFDGHLLVDVQLWPSKDDVEAQRRLDDVTKVLAATDCTVVTTDRRALSTLARARVTTAGLEALLDLGVVERIRTPLAPFIEPSDWLTATIDDLTHPPSLPVTIGVVDDGVHSGHPLLAGLIVSEASVPAAHTWAPPTHHGTMVAGLAAFGDLEASLRDHEPLPTPALLAVVRVLEHDPADPDPDSTRFPTEQTEHETIEIAIRALHAQGVRIVNISIADPNAYSGPHVSIWTETLDRLARELDLVLVVAAGNRQLPSNGDIGPGIHAHASYPTYLLDAEARVAEPAVAANVIAVGSLARSSAAALPGGRSHPQDIAIARSDELSPFSRTGPGVNGTFRLGAVKPDFVHYGGNTVWTQANRLNHLDPGASVVSTALEPSGRLFRVSAGTSYAAPRVAHAAAEVLHRRPTASANLVRALLGVSASIPTEAAKQFADPKERHRAFGYGLPDGRKAAESDRNRVVLLHEGSMAIDTAVIHSIPVPAAFATGKADRAITVALAYDPPVRRQRREYIAGHITMDLYRAMTIEEVEQIVRKQPKGDTIALPDDRRRVTPRLAPGTQLSGASTLQVRQWHAPGANSLLPDDGDTYFLVLKHYTESWGSRLPEPYEEQRYAVVVQLEDRSRVTVDLHALLDTQIREQARLRVTP